MWYYTCTYFLNFLFYLSLEGTDNIRSSEQILNDNEIPNLRLPCSWIYMYSNYIFISTYDVLYTRVQCTWSMSQWPAYITYISKHWVTLNTGKIMHNHLFINVDACTFIQKNVKSRPCTPTHGYYYGLKGWTSFKFMTQHSWYASKILINRIPST